MKSFLWLAPYHLYIVVFTILFLVYAWYDKLKRSQDIDCACDEKGFFYGKPFLALVSVASIIILSFPLWGSRYFKEVPSAEICITGACDTQVNAAEEVVEEVSPKTITNVDTSEVPVLSYMQEERLHPTPNHQVSCSGTGYYALDTLMFQVRQEVPEMPPAVLKKMLDNDEDVILLDVREFIQRSEGEIYADESYAISRTNLEFEVMNTLKDKDALVVVYSRQGARSLFAAESLKRLGYTQVYNLKAGLKGWVRENYPYENGLGIVVKVVDE